MYSQSKSDRLRNIGNKSLHLTEFSQGMLPFSKVQASLQNRREKAKSEYSQKGFDSLQLFQQELNSVMMAKKTKNTVKKSRLTQKTQGSIPQSQQDVMQLKNQVNQIKSIIQSQRQVKQMQNKLERLLVSLQQQKIKRNFDKSMYSSNPREPQQVIVPQPQIIYPPQPMYYPPPMYESKFNKHCCDHNEQERFCGKRRTKTSSEGFEKVKKKVKYNRLRVIFFTVAFTIFLRSEAKKLSMARKGILKKFWAEKFEGQMSNLKNWLLETQKFSFSIILEKKNLKLSFFDQKSERVKQQKQNFIMQVVGIGINKMLEDCTSQKISQFSELLLNICRRGSFALNRFWTAYELQQICISQYFGFFRIDASLEKFLIGLMVLIKVFVFNMLLQPSKFDSKNFPKKEQPIASNMKLIGSTFYHLAKEIIDDFRNQDRSEAVYQIGNWLQVPKQFIVECSSPLVYGKEPPQDGEYISGLLSENEIGELKNLQAWALCSKKMKGIIQKLYSETVSKCRMVKRNLKYKLYN